MHYVFDVDGALSFDGKKIAIPIVIKTIRAYC